MKTKLWRQKLKAAVQTLQYSFLQETHPLIVGTLSALLSVGLWQAGFWQPLERLGSNALFQVRNQLLPLQWDSRIAVIAIDDPTLEQYKTFPLPRHRYQELLETLAASPPAAIGFDILFVEPTVQDRALADAMFNMDTVVLAIATNYQGRSLNLVPELAQVTDQGHILTPAEPDGIRRQAFLYINQAPALGITLLQAYNSSLQQVVNSQGTAPLQPVTLPAPQAQVKEQTRWLNWPGPIRALPTYSLADILNGKIASQSLANKIVLVGVTAMGEDTIRTPFDQKTPIGGVYSHAAVLDNLLSQRFLEVLPWQAEVLLLVGVAIGAGLVLSPLDFQRRLLLLLAAPLLWFAIAVTGFSMRELWLPVAAPVGAFLLTGLGVQLQEQRQKQMIMSLFGRHVSPTTAALIWQNRGEIFQSGQLEPQEMMVTILFMDIRGFTTISEAMSPRELMDWLNRYLNTMTACIQTHQGVVDKYMGDAIMAVFGIPLPHSRPEEIQQDALNAVTAAISMRDRLTRLNQEFQQTGKPLIRYGIGIHTGRVIAGTVGGDDRVNYSVLGDAVNVAARLEPLNKQIQEDNPYSVLVSSETFAYINQRFVGQPVEVLQLRGRQKTTQVYSILGEPIRGETA